LSAREGAWSGRSLVSLFLSFWFLFSSFFWGRFFAGFAVFFFALLFWGFFWGGTGFGAGERRFVVLVRVGH
jgi:hypothetical protein